MFSVFLKLPAVSEVRKFIKVGCKIAMANSPLQHRQQFIGVYIYGKINEIIEASGFHCAKSIQGEVLSTDFFFLQPHS